MDFPISVPNIGLVGGKFIDEDPLAGTPGSLIPSAWGNSITDEVLNVITAAGLAPSEANHAQLLAAIRLINQKGQESFAVDTGVANAYVCAFAPAITARSESRVLRFKVKTTNTGASTLHDGVGPAPLVGVTHSALQAGELVANGECWVQWNASVAGGAYVVLLSTGAAPQVASAARVSGLSGKNNAGTPGTKFDFNALSVTLRNPATGATAVVNNTGVLVNDLIVPGPAANGRDQAAAFTASQWLYYYFIWNPATSTLSTIVSLGMPTTGPALPAGYTHWAYIGAVYFGSGSVLALGNFRGCWFNYLTMQPIVTNGSALTPSGIAVTAFVPPVAVAPMMELAIPNLSIVSNAGGSYSVTCAISMEAGGATTMQLGLQGGGLGSTNFGVAGTSKRLPNLSQGFNYQLFVNVGTGHVVSIAMCGYSNANGGEG
jgi:hypothetical protein